MRLDKIDVFHVAMPLKQPWKTAFSEEHAIDSVLVRIRSGDDIGWGEAAPYAAPEFSPEWAGGCTHLIRNILAPFLECTSIASGQELQHKLSRFKGNQFAKGAIDTAYWDLVAKKKGVSLWTLIGGTNPEIAVGADIPVQDSVQKLLADVAASIEAGFPRTKLKFRRDSGFEMVRRVREAFPDATIHIDCNGGFTLEDLPLFRELDALQLTMIEQPLSGDDLIDHARLQEHLDTPICLDESITSVKRAEQAIDIGAARWINIKHGRVGGLTNAIEIHKLCIKRDVPCWIGGMLESFVGQGVSMAMATLPGQAYAADIFPEGRLYADDLAHPPILLSGSGTAMAPDRPGHGFEPVPERLKNCLVRQ
ncbi:o-succinylbenzoate synthase [Tropicimonas isoalkanivorans]|uniref:o-succinylbenzoate synthase n=1 Tax=Tropicimonas isoalkanivorans TaxID=441112 RepID=A0A1I1IBR0_9RHOB|nr:o-succinylbenzoate synthase [Tropicimonas isoalkanivorans]SFC33819.1 O-succinylbenzoate synthase [Tropicimonas isoalkanivorans]